MFCDADTAKQFRDLFMRNPQATAVISIHIPVFEFNELANWTEQELEAQNPKCDCQQWLGLTFINLAFSC